MDQNVTDTSHLVGFTPKLWLWWIVATVASDLAVTTGNRWLFWSDDDDGAGAAIGIIIAIAFLDAFFVLVLATAQWLVLRHAFAQLKWSTWLAVCALFACCTAIIFWNSFSTVVTLPAKLSIVLLTIIPAGSAAIALGFARRPRAFAVIFLAFLAAAALTSFIQIYALTNLKSHIFLPFSEILRLARGTLVDSGIHSLPFPPDALIPSTSTSIAVVVFLTEITASGLGAALSGLGLWTVSRGSRQSLDDDSLACR
jgi:hypothetical protein